MTISMPKCQCFGSQPVLPYETVESSREKEGLSLEIERETLENTRLSVNSARQRESKTTFCAPCWDGCCAIKTGELLIDGRSDCRRVGGERGGGSGARSMTLSL